MKVRILVTEQGKVINLNKLKKNKFTIFLVSLFQKTGFQLSFNHFINT